MTREAAVKVIWASLLPAAQDRGGGATYSAMLQKLLTAEFGSEHLERIYVLPGSSPVRKLKLLVALAIALMLPMSAKILYCLSISAFRTVRRSDADILVCDHVETAYLTRAFRGSRTVVVLHNVESDIMRGRGESARGVRGWFLRREARRMARFERCAIGAATDSISLSCDDIASFAARGVTGIRHIPPVFAYPIRARPVMAPDRLRLGFVGQLDWWPNAEGLAWFLDHIYPHLSPDRLPLHIVGGGDASRFARTGVTSHGYLPAIQDVWSQFDVMISPILSGSGVSIKSAEALYNGLPLLSTSVGIRGLAGLEHAPGIMVADSVQAWVAILRRWEGGERPPAVAASLARGFALDELLSAENGV